MFPDGDTCLLNFSREYLDLELSYYDVKLAVSSSALITP